VDGRDKPGHDKSLLSNAGIRALRDGFPLRRRVVRVSPAGKRWPVEGCASRPREAKLFRGSPIFSKEITRQFQAFPNFSKDFQTFSLAVSWEIKGLWADRPENALSPFSCAAPAAGQAPGDTLPHALAIQDSANSDYRKELVVVIFGRGVGASAARRRRRRESRDRRYSAASCKLGRERRRPHGGQNFRSRAAVKGRSPPAAARDQRALDSRSASERNASMSSTARWVGGSRAARWLVEHAVRYVRLVRRHRNRRESLPSTACDAVFRCVVAWRGLIDIRDLWACHRIPYSEYCYFTYSS
jgi:hypothetical protein